MNQPMNDQKTKTKVVVVDDDESIHDLMIAYFKPRGFEVITYLDAESALEESLKNGATWDVLLTDLCLPRMSGVEFTEEIKKNWPDLPIILVTTTRTAEAAVDAIQKGAYDFIVKPIYFPQLQMSVERALYLKALKGDINELRQRVKGENSFQDNIVGHSPSFLNVLDIAKRVAPSHANIFITGESGTGKELVAKFIHNSSRQSKGPFVAINCSAIPETLLESELFGHAKGSFTGAQDKKMGLFEEAEDGTLFLDEIGDLSLSLQSKLLRVLQDKKIRRVGENHDRDINCRVISATHKDLNLEINENRFREDLFFRLNVIPISIPPLRDRTEDLLPLAQAFLRKYTLINGASAKSFSKEAMKYIVENKWRGNVRELENAVERAVILCRDREISLEDFMPATSQLEATRSKEEKLPQEETIFAVGCSNELPSLDEITHKYIEYAVRRNGGARDLTARKIGIDRKTLYKKMKQEHSASSAIQ